jgi:hypothetical protein
MGKYLNKPTDQAPPSSSSPLCPSGEWPILYPALYEFLTLTVWEDGSMRQCGSLTLFVDQSLWKCCLSDKDGHRVAFVSGGSVEGVLQAAEGGIVRSELDWREARGPSYKRKPKNA